MTEEMLANAIGNIGVPAALCFYVLFALNKSVNKLIESVKSLENEIRLLRRD